MSRWPGDDEPAEEDLEGQWELDPNDPSHPDYDLSTAASYADWEPARTPFLARRRVMLLIVLLIIAAIIGIPILRLI